MGSPGSSHVDKLEHIPGGYAECRTVNGITGQTVRTGQCDFFGPLFQFLCDILHPHPVNLTLENERPVQG